MSYPNPGDLKINHNRCVEVDYFVYIEMYEAAEAYARQGESERQLRKLCNELCAELENRDNVPLPSPIMGGLLCDLDIATRCLERLCGK